MDTTTKEITAQQRATSQLSAGHDTQTATDKADTTQKGPALEDTAADHPAEIAAHHHREADVLTVQADTAYAASIGINKGPHHITSTLLQLQSPVQHLTVTQKKYLYNLTNAQTELQHPYQPSSSQFTHTVTQKTQIQHVMNYQYQTHHQKQSQTLVTDYYQMT